MKNDKFETEDLIHEATILLNLVTHLLVKFEPLITVLAPLGYGLLEELLSNQGIDINEYRSMVNRDVSEEGTDKDATGN